MRLLTVNTGSSSLKLSIIEEGRTTAATHQLGSPGDPATLAALRGLLGRWGDVDAAVHRFVHGGDRLFSPVVVDGPVRAQIEAAAVMAPLHVPLALGVLTAVQEQVDRPHVACFDTGFHAGMPEGSRTYAIPRPWRDLGVRRYGFHGLSDAWASRRAAELLGRPDAAAVRPPAAELELRARPDAGPELIVAHLGAGASVTAVSHGRSVDTTMGFSPLDGLVMATRSGAIDPGAVLWLQTVHGLSAAEVGEALEQRSGLLGLCGSADMREVFHRARPRTAGGDGQGDGVRAGDGAGEGAGSDGAADADADADADARARLALDVFVRSVARGVGMVSASLDHVDALVFTGGIGENQPGIRREVCRRLGPLGITADLAGEVEGDAIVSREGAAVAVLVVQAREDLQMAGEAERLLAP